mmetsp:Transcript_24951/g.56311  ORF Transcript_24951/g.56311 Transcript_24951/m.56311 type:complete len:282 (-) Transcript_24951:45-890(-)
MPAQHLQRPCWPTGERVLSPLPQQLLRHGRASSLLLLRRLLLSWTVPGLSSWEVQAVSGLRQLPHVGHVKGREREQRSVLLSGGILRIQRLVLHDVSVEHNLAPRGYFALGLLLRGGLLRVPHQLPQVPVVVKLFSWKYQPVKLHVRGRISRKPQHGPQLQALLPHRLQLLQLGIFLQLLLQPGLLRLLRRGRWSSPGQLLAVPRRNLQSLPSCDPLLVMSQQQDFSARKHQPQLLRLPRWDRRGQRRVRHQRCYSSPLLLAGQLLLPLLLLADHVRLLPV